MYEPHQIIALAQAYRAATGLALKTISRRALGPQNWAAFERLAEGRGCNSSTLAKATKFFNGPAPEDWPDGLAWPLDIEQLEKGTTNGTAKRKQRRRA